jgi:hypothetical protein
MFGCVSPYAAGLHLSLCNAVCEPLSSYVGRRRQQKIHPYLKMIPAKLAEGYKKRPQFTGPAITYWLLPHQAL